MTRSRGPLVDAVAVSAFASLLLAAAAGLQHVRERAFPAEPITEQPLYITSGTVLRRLSAGYNALAADLYWIRAVQYYGAERLRLARPASDPRPTEPQTSFELLYPLLDATTTLDPRFNIAYRFGAIFLAEPFPGGAGRSDLAIALLEKGLRERPDKWEYMLDIGYVHYWQRHDFRNAAHWFDQGSQMPGAPWWLRSLAAVTMAEGGDRQSSRVMWEAILESAEIQYLRDQAERSLMQLRALDEIDALQASVDRVTAMAGARPADWAPLVAARLLSRIPVDPAGTPYEIDPMGRVRLSPGSALYPLPDEPKRLVAPIS